MIKSAFIRKLPGGKWRIFSKKHKNLGTFNSRSAAKKHLREIEFFKRKKAMTFVFNICKQAEENNIDITTTYSAMMRKLRKEDPDKVKPFMKAFKNAFDEAIQEDVEEAENAALMQTLQTMDLE